MYLKSYQDSRDARISLGNYFRFYNTERPHQALGYRTPAEVFIPNAAEGFIPTIVEDTEGGVIESLASGTLKTVEHYLNLTPLLS
jgi:putative transposase